MKKGLWMAAFVAATLSSCTQNEEIGKAMDGNNAAINFSTYVGKSTRAGIMDSDVLKDGGTDNGFYVLAYSTGKDAWNTDAEQGPTLNFMLNDQVYYNETGSAWTYNNIKYWPNEVDGTNLGKVSFFAYAPVDNAVEVTPADASAGFPELTYTCPEDPDEQKDVVAAKALDKTKTDGTVNLTFGHILSKIGFSAKLDKEYENATITVTGMKVLYGTSMAQANTYRLDKEAWGDLEDATKFEEGAEGAVLADAEIDLSTDAASLINEDDDNYLMMLPQEVANEAFKVELTYTVADDERETSVTNTVTVPLPEVEWAKGSQYTYVLAVSEDAVVFDNITVSEFDANTDIAVPEEAED